MTRTALAAVLAAATLTVGANAQAAGSGPAGEPATAGVAMPSSAGSAGGGPGGAAGAGIGAAGASGATGMSVGGQGAYGTGAFGMTANGPGAGLDSSSTVPPAAVPATGAASETVMIPGYPVNRAR